VPVVFSAELILKVEVGLKKSNVYTAS